MGKNPAQVDIINGILSKNKKPTEEELIVFKNCLDELLEAYLKGKPLMPNSEYDVLLEKYLKYTDEKNRPFLRNKQSSAINDIVGTLPKVFGVTTPFRWDQKCYADWCKGEKFAILLQPKFDGCSIALDIQSERFLTRGDYDNGESVDVTDLFTKTYRFHNVLYIQELLEEYKGFRSVKFEAIMNKQNFESLKLCGKDGKPYVDPRAAVSGIISSRNIDLMKYVECIGLRAIDFEGRHWFCPRLISVSEVNAWSNDYDNIQTFIDNILNDGATVTFDTGATFDVDGVVISQMVDKDNPQPWIQVHPSINEIAIKILNVIKETKINNIEYQFGLAGRITPVAKVDPVDFEGRTITSITLSTLDRVASLGMNYGDTVKVTYNIVPYLLSSKHDGQYPIQIPTKCPHCDMDFDMSTLKQVKCRNPKCAGMRLGAVIRYCKKMNMFGISNGNITKLWEAGTITSIPSLYQLTVEKICSVPGFKETSAKNIINSIQKSSKDVELHKWLGAWPMDDVSHKTWQAFIEQSTLQDKTFLEDFMTSFNHEEAIMRFTHWMFTQSGVNYHGIGEITKRKMCIGMDNNAMEMTNVYQHITFKSNIKIIGKVCLSGTRNKNLIQGLQNQGWEVTDNLTKDCRVLLTTDMNSTKAKKALKLDIMIIPINENGNFEGFKLSIF